MSRLGRRPAAALAVVLALTSLALGVALALATVPRGLVGLALLVLAAGLAWHGLLHRGPVRVVAVATGVVLAGVVVGLLVAREPVLVLGAVAALWLALAAARLAFRIHVTLPAAPRPSHPVLFYNPRSGGGKAERLGLPDRARALGIEPVELGPGSDLAQLVRRAVADGADALAMAGGDGSQAVVASIAAEHGLPYACIPAGTRNHFALDLGVDRDDPVGALDALVDGGERVVDLGEVNGRVFVNNVSLGVYGEAAQRAGYRDAKMKTLLDTIPDVAEAEPGTGVRWHDAEGHEHEGGAAILVANNRYRLGHAIGSGTRPRLDEGVLGVTVFGRPAGEDGPQQLSERPWRAWTTPEFEVQAPGPVAMGIDGEAVELAPPLRFRMRLGALRCRIARHHPGASPSAFEPDRPLEGLRVLAQIAAGRDPRPVP